VKEGAGDGFIEGAKLQDFSQVIGSVFKDEGRASFRTVCFLVGSFFNALVELDDVGMVEFCEYGWLFFEDAVEDLLRVGIALGGELDGVELTILWGQLNSEWIYSYLPKVPSPSTWIIWYFS
jgi:hypothetical protein